MLPTNATPTVPQRGLLTWVMRLLPIAVLSIILVVFLTGNPLGFLTGNAPPIEQLSVQHITLDHRGILLNVINSGSDPINIAQVLVDDAYWNFSFEQGDNQLNRLETAAVRIPYPWVQGEAHTVALLTRTGLTFPVEIPVAVATPQVTANQLAAFALLGFYVGIVPVALGMLWYPFMRTINRRWLNFVLALTVGLLVFLAIDTLLEALEIGSKIPGVFQGVPLVLLVSLFAFLSIVSIGRSRFRSDSRLFLAYMIALGIGFHNLGEGLAVGAAVALGQVSLGAFLVVGFVLHNITEGIGIAAPVVTERPRLWHFIALVLLAGSPAVVGTLIGGFAFDPLLAVIFLGIGVGAILQVIYEVTRMIIRDSQRHSEEPLSWLNLAGLVTGIAIMYFTAFLVA